MLAIRQNPDSKRAFCAGFVSAKFAKAESKNLDSSGAESKSLTNADFWHAESKKLESTRASLIASALLACFALVMLSGCFIQDFNAHARQAGYSQSGKSASAGKTAKSTKGTKSTKNTRASSTASKVDSLFDSGGSAGGGAKADSSSKSASKSASKSTMLGASERQVLDELLRQQKRWGATPYVSGGVRREGADCSGFVMSVFSESFGLSVPRVTVSQMEQGKKLGGKNIAASKLKAGDLIFFKTGHGMHGYHVGIYLQDGEFMHLSTKGGAKIASMSNSYWKPKIIKAVRYPINK